MKYIHLYPEELKLVLREHSGCWVFRNLDRKKLNFAHAKIDSKINQSYSLWLSADQALFNLRLELISIIDEIELKRR